MKYKGILYLIIVSLSLNFYNSEIEAQITRPTREQLKNSPSLLQESKKRRVYVQEKYRNSRTTYAMPEQLTKYWPITGWNTTKAADLNSAFGARHFSSDNYDFHEGNDISADDGTPVHPMADGTVWNIVDPGRIQLIASQLVSF